MIMLWRKLKNLKNQTVESLQILIVIVTACTSLYPLGTLVFGNDLTLKEWN